MLGFLLGCTADPKCFVIAICDYTHCGNVYKKDVAETSEHLRKVKPPLKKKQKNKRIESANAFAVAACFL